MKKNYLLILVTVIFLSTWANAQSISPFVIAPAGGEGSGNNMNIQWTLGEMMIETFEANDLILTQGFHQPHLIVTSVEELPGYEISIDAFPNPTSDLVNIRINDESFAGLQYKLFDSNGRLVDTNTLENSITKINLSDKQPGVFFLIVSKERKEIKTFKIVKNR